MGISESTIGKCLCCRNRKARRIETCSSSKVHPQRNSVIPPCATHLPLYDKAGDVATRYVMVNAAYQTLADRRHVIGVRQPKAPAIL